jgi:hypothetical protein
MAWIKQVPFISIKTQAGKKLRFLLRKDQWGCLAMILMVMATKILLFAINTEKPWNRLTL